MQLFAVGNIKNDFNMSHILGNNESRVTNTNSKELFIQSFVDTPANFYLCISIIFQVLTNQTFVKKSFFSLFLLRPPDRTKSPPETDKKDSIYKTH